MNFNSYWYLGLSAVSAGLLAFVYFKTKNPRSLLLYTGMTGIGYLAEFVAYVLFDSYQYFPKVLANPYHDSNMGAFTSNLLTLPVSATCIAVFRLRWKAIFAITALICGIESLFLTLKLYEHHWWRIWFTAAGLPIYFYIAKVWLTSMMRPMKGFLKIATLFLVSGALLGTLQFMPIAFFGSRSYNIGWFDNPARDTTAFATVFWLCLSGVYTTILNFRWKHAMLKIGACIVVLVWLTIVLEKANILICHVWWDTYYCVLVCFMVLLYLEWLRKRLISGPHGISGPV